MNRQTLAAACLAAIVLAAAPLRAQVMTTPPILREVSISQNLNAQIPRGPCVSR